MPRQNKRNIAFTAEEDAIKIVEVNVDMFELGRRIGGKGLTSAVAVIDKNMASAIAGIAGGSEDKKA